MACVRPVVSPPVRRPDVRGCSPPSVVGRQFRRFGRACQASALKPAAQGRTGSMGSARSSALSGRRGSGEIRFMVGGGRRPIMWVFWDEKRRRRWSKVVPWVRLMILVGHNCSPRNTWVGRRERVWNRLNPKKHDMRPGAVALLAIKCCFECNSPIGGIAAAPKSMGCTFLVCVFRSECSDPAARSGRRAAAGILRIRIQHIRSFRAFGRDLQRIQIRRNAQLASAAHAELHPESEAFRIERCPAICNLNSNEGSKSGAIAETASAKGS